MKKITVCILAALAASVMLSLRVNAENEVCLSSLTPLSWVRYEGNLGDSCLYSLDGNGLTDKVYGWGIRNGPDGFSDGFEAWLARWNYMEEKSRVGAVYNLDGEYTTLTGKTSLINSYNMDNFDTTLFFSDEEGTMLFSRVLTDEDYTCNFTIDVSGVKYLTVGLTDNVAVAGGTSFAIYDLFLTPVSYTPEEQHFIDEHVAFIENGDFVTALRTLSFYSAVWQYQQFEGLKLFFCGVYDTVDDVGDVLSLDLGDLTVLQADYYDLYLTDYINSLVDGTTIPGLSSTAFSAYKTLYKNLNFILQNDKWSAKINEKPSIKEELKNFLISSPESPEILSSDAKNILNSILGDMLKDPNARKNLEQIFQGLDTAGDICDYITQGATLVDGFFNASNTYAVIMAYKSLDSDIGDNLDRVAAKMEQQDPAAGKKFRRSVSKFRSAATNDKALLQAAKEMIKPGVTFLYDTVLQEPLKQFTYQHLAKFLTASTGKVIPVSQIGAIVIAYNATLAATDLILHNSDKTDLYKNMSALAKVEAACANVTAECAAALLKKKTLQNAKEFDQSYYTLRDINKTLYSLAYDFGKVKNQPGEMACAAWVKAQWDCYLCHCGSYDGLALERDDPLYADAAEQEQKIVSVFCPCDVVIFDRNGVEVAAVRSETIVRNDRNMFIEVRGGRKTLIFPANESYSIVIEAREDGRMEYYVREVDAVSGTVRSVEFYDIPLIAEKSFSGSLPEGIHVESESYMLEAENTEYTADYDSSEVLGCSETGHDFGEWSISEGEEEGTFFKNHVCTVCGKKESVEADDRLTVGVYYDITNDVAKGVIRVPEEFSGNSLVAAQYDGGKLLRCSVFKPEKEIEISLDENADLLKAIVLESMDSLMPVSGSAEKAFDPEHLHYVTRKKNYADKNVLYVKQGETTGTGNEFAPFGTIEEAISALDGEDGTVVIVGTYNISGFNAPEWNGMITVTGENADSVLVSNANSSICFNGDITIKDIRFESGLFSHINPENHKLVYDADSEFHMVHATTYRDAFNDFAEFVMESGKITSFFFGGGYSTDVNSGVSGDTDFVMNGGEIGLFYFSADTYRAEHTGTSISKNANVIINGGKVGSFLWNNKTVMNISGALNIIFNNGTAADIPSDFSYPEAYVSEGVYIVRSEKGGTVLPTSVPGVFEVCADEGRLAVINGIETENGNVRLECGENTVVWSETVQAENDGEE